MNRFLSTPPIRKARALRRAGPQAVTACRRLAPGAFLSDGHQVARENLRQLHTRRGGTSSDRTQACWSARLRGLEQTHARLSWAGPALADPGGRAEREVSHLSTNWNVICGAGAARKCAARAAADEDIGERSAVDLVAGRALKQTRKQCLEERRAAGRARQACA